MLARYAGFWSLVVCSCEILCLTYVLWARTGFGFFERVLRKLSWTVVPALYLAYRIGDKIPNARQIRTYDQFGPFPPLPGTRETSPRLGHARPHKTLPRAPCPATLTGCSF